MFREAVLGFLGVGANVRSPLQRAKCDEGQRAKCKHEFGEFMEWSCKNCLHKKMQGNQEDCNNDKLWP